MKAILGLLCGALCAVVIACGGAQKAAMGPPPVAAESAARSPIAAGPGADQRAELDRLDREIDDGLAKLGIARPAVPESACVTPPCATTMSEPGVRSPPGIDPTCKPGETDKCKDSCKLSDAICDASQRICRIASDLHGDDRYANEKCAGGHESCKASRKECCGCL